MNRIKEFLMRKSSGICGTDMVKPLLIIMILVVILLIFKEPITASLQSFFDNIT